MKKSVSSEKAKFDPKAFLATIDNGRTMSEYSKKQSIFAQGDPSDSVFYIQQGKVKLTVVSTAGKEATIGLLSSGDFFGEAVTVFRSDALVLGGFPFGS